MRKPASVSLQVFSDFRASHSLAGFELPHFHLWKLTLEFRAPLPLPNDRLIDLVYLQEEVQKITQPLEGRYLNEALGFDPTSENVAEWLWGEFLKRHPASPLTAATVTLCDLSGVAMGSARVEA